MTKRILVVEDQEDLMVTTRPGTSMHCLVSLQPSIIAVSSFATKGDEEKARASGCDGYVTKPYSPVQLLRIIQSYLGGQL
jgi:CheY-like chemotaxis protein